MRPDRGVEGVGCFGCAVTGGRERQQYVAIGCERTVRDSREQRTIAHGRGRGADGQ